MNNFNKPKASEIKPFELAIIWLRGTAESDDPELAAMRKQPPACFSRKLAPLFLKHSDEQSLASPMALYRATATLVWKARILVPGRRLDFRSAAAHSSQ